MALIPCVYYNLPGECSKTASVLYEDICTGHASKVFGIGQKNIMLPRSVARSINDLTTNDSLGISLIAEWQDHQKCDDVVFNENDTVIPFSEYKAKALENCKFNNIGATVVEQFTQRAFAMLLADLRIKIKCASLFPLNSSYRTRLLLSAVETIQKILKDYPSHNFKVEDLVSEKIIYVTNKFQLSKPLIEFFRSLLVPACAGEYEPMVWNLYGNIAIKNEDNIGMIDLFLQHNTSNFISGSFKVPVCRREGSLQCDVIAEKITNIHRETYYRHAKNDKPVRRYARRPLINQYDESILGTCHNYFLPIFTELFSIRALSALMMIVLPIGTKKRPRGNVSLLDYLAFFTDKHIFTSKEKHGLGKDEALAKMFSKAISLLDYQEPPLSGAKDFSTNELITLRTSPKQSDNTEDDKEEGELDNDISFQKEDFDDSQIRAKRTRNSSDDWYVRNAAFF